MRISATCGLAFALSIALNGMVATAQSAAVDGARAAFEEGIGALEADRCEDAIAHFRRSIALSEGVAAGHNLGVALEECGQVLESVSVLEDLLVKIDEDRFGSVSTDRRQVVEEQLRHSRSQLAVLRVELAEGVTGDVEIRVDGLLRGTARPGSEVRVQVDPGRHHVEGSGTNAVDRSVGRGEVDRVVLDRVHAAEELGRLVVDASGTIDVVGYGQASDHFDERLPVGTYEVRAGGEVRTVEIEDGQLSRLTFDEASSSSRRGWIIGVIVGVVVVGAAVGTGVARANRGDDFAFSVRALRR